MHLELSLLAVSPHRIGRPWAGSCVLGDSVGPNGDAAQLVILESHLQNDKGDIAMVATSLSLLHGLHSGQSSFTPAVMLMLLS